MGFSNGIPGSLVGSTEGGLLRYSSLLEPYGKIKRSVTLSLLSESLSSVCVTTALRGW